MRFFAQLRFCCVGALMAGVGNWAYAIDAGWLIDAQTLLENGQAQQAYTILKQQEDQYIGTPEFDKALAQAALGVGAQNEATLALERILNVDNQAVTLRMELARIYQAMANDEQAKYQFAKVVTSTTNSGMVQEAQANLKVIEERLSKRRKRPAFDPQLASQATPVVSAVKPALEEKYAAPLRDLNSLMASAREVLTTGQPMAAFEMLAEREFDGAGDVEFDYLLGTAAIDAGKPDRATLALERVLAVNPTFAGARIDMGRAYMLLGNTLQAQEEFDAVLKLNPPDAVKRQVEGFAAQIEQRKQVAKTTWGGFFGISLGRDSNVNSAPADAEQLLPIAGHNVFLDPNSVQTPSNYVGVNGRIQVNHRANETVAVYAGVDMDLQRNFQASQFDRSAIDLRLGSIFTLKKHELEFSLVVGKTYLEQRSYRSLTGGAVQWRFNLNEDNQLQTLVQFNRLAYPQQEASVFDTDQTVLGFSWLRLFGANKQGLGFIGAYQGKETDANGNPSGAKDFYGVRAGGQWGFGARWAIYSTLGVALASYDGIELSQQKSRDDRHFDLNLGVNYLLWDSWSLRPQISMTRHDSNIGLYDFSRRELSVTLRRDWR